MKLGVVRIKVILEMKSYLFPYEKPPQNFNKLLSAYIKDGSVTPSKKELFIDSDFEILTFAVSNSLKQKIKKASIEKNKSMEELICEIMFDHFSLEE